MNDIHGGEIYDKEITMDYSINVNPFGMPDSVKQAIKEHGNEYSKYPDDNCTKLREKLSEFHQVPKEYILCGNGAADLIYRICFALKPKKAMLLAPTFSEYENALRQTGCFIEYYDLLEEDSFSVSNQIIDKVDDSLDLIILCNPNNPVGNLIKKEILEQLFCNCERFGIVVLMDECFMDFTTNPQENSMIWDIKQNTSFIILKAFTKTYAMAGIRLGYLICANIELVKEIKKAGPPWSVSAPAQIGGAAAIQEDTYVERTREYIQRERNWMQESLHKMGLSFFQSETNYILFRSYPALYEDLIKRRILIRQCKNYRNLDGTYYRISVGLHEENKRLLKMIQECLEEKDGETNYDSGNHVQCR